MLKPILVVLAALSAFFCIRADYRNLRRSIYVFKPLTMAMILLIAVLGHTAPPVYKGMIIAGLVFSTTGDVLLMLPSDRFLAGMVAFLLAHLCYIAAFASGIGTPLWWPVIPFVVCGAVVYIILSPSLGNLKLPVYIYVVSILMMAWLAWERGIQTGQSGALLATIGAVLFIVSDTVLAINRFRRKFKLACVLNLATYFTAQCLLAGSVGFLVF